jgi:hypothetical protein
VTEHSDRAHGGGPDGPGPAADGGPGGDDGFEIPVFDSVEPGSGPVPGPAGGPGGGPLGGAGDGPQTGPGTGSGPAGGPGPAEGAPAGRSAPAGRLAGDSEDWTRTDSVRDDPGTLGEEVRKLWEVVHDHFVDPVLRNYPEAAGHLTSAGLEVASAFRALVRGSEQRWTGAPPAGRGRDSGPDWDGRIVIGEDGGDIDDDTADRPKD